MPQYTEAERAIRHQRIYGEYPPPPRQYRKQDAEGVPTFRRYRTARLAGDDNMVEHPLRRGFGGIPSPMQWREAYQQKQNVTSVSDGVWGRCPSPMPSWLPIAMLTMMVLNFLKK